MQPQSRTREWDLALARLAGAQHGVVSRRQLEGLGMTREAIRVRLRNGRLHRLGPGVYAVGHTVGSRHADWTAQVLGCGEGAVLSHRSAAALWGIRPSSGSRVDVTSPRKTKSRGRLRRHHALLPPDEVTVEDGIAVTTVPRTVFDLGSVEPAQAVESALRQCEYLRLWDHLSVWDLVRRYPGHRGIRSVRAALVNLGHAPGRTESPLEDRFLAFLDARGLPRPHFNPWIELGDGRRHRVDCLWPDHKLVAELDSWQVHGTRSAFQADRARARRLLRAGYRTVHITHRQLESEPRELAADLHALLR